MERTPSPSFAEAARLWLYLGFVNFGGPAAQIAIMHKLVVDDRKWIDERQYLHALNYCTLLPGPEAQQLATYIGWLLHRTWGGIVAGVFFILPGFVLMMGLSALYAGWGQVPLVDALFYGLRAAILGIVIQAVLRVGSRALGHGVFVAIAAIAFVLLFFVDVPFPWVVLAAAAAGGIGSRMRPDIFTVGGGHGGVTAGGPAAAPAVAAIPKSSPLRVAIVCLALWFAPVVAAFVWIGPSNVWVDLGLFFSKMAVVTFGGAYAVLAYVAQEAVERYGWLAADEMLSGLALAETTPGPLILVVQFVGFLAGYRDPGALAPMLAGAIAGTLAVWVTFVPSFLWIFLGAPYVERLQNNRALNGALKAITAAVVGVIANLAVWFGLQVIFEKIAFVDRFGLRVPIADLGTIDAVAAGIAVASIAAQVRYKVGMIPTLVGAAAIGIVWRLLVA